MLPPFAEWISQRNPSIACLTGGKQPIFVANETIAATPVGQKFYFVGSGMRSHEFMGASFCGHKFPAAKSKKDGALTPVIAPPPATRTSTDALCPLPVGRRLHFRWLQRLDVNQTGALRSAALCDFGAEASAAQRARVAAMQIPTDLIQIKILTSAGTCLLQMQLVSIG
jgi:hypothetical protein